MNPTRLNQAVAAHEPWTVVPYQSTHNTGGTIMGTNPRNSVVNKYLQSWDCHNLFIDRRQRVPAQRDLQPDRAGRRARLLDGGRDQEPLRQEPRAAGAGMTGSGNARSIC